MGLLDLFDSPEALQGLLGSDMLGQPQGGQPPPAPGGQPPAPPPPPPQMASAAPTFAPNSTLDANAFAPPGAPGGLSGGATPLPPELIGGGGGAAEPQIPMPKPRPPSRPAQIMPKSLEPIIVDAAEREGLDADYLARIAKIESGFNPRARTGSYKGLFQLSDSEFSKNGGGDIYNPEHNASAAAAKMAQEASNFREKYGRDPTPTEHYLIHQQGEGGSDAHFQNPNTPAWENMYSTAEGQQKGPAWAKRAIWGNIPDGMKARFGNVNNVTSADFVSMWRNKVEGENATPPDRTGMDGANAVRARLGGGSPMGVPPGASAMAVPPGGLAESLGAGGAQSRFGGRWAPAFAALGQGLSAVGAQHPGASGAASFAAGLGGALQGGVKQADVQKAQQRQEDNDKFVHSSTAFRDMLAADARDDTHAHNLASIEYLKARAMSAATGKGSGAWYGTPEGKLYMAEKRVNDYIGPQRKSIDAMVRAGRMEPEEADKRYQELKKEEESYRGRIYKGMGIDPKDAEDLKTKGTRANPYDAKGMTEDEFHTRVPMGGYFKDHSGKLRQRTKPPPGAEIAPVPGAAPASTAAGSYGEMVDDQTATTPPAS